MNTFKGLLIDNGVIKAGEFPVEPESFIPETEEEYNMALHDAQNELPQYMHREYKSALASAKANAVECEDQTLAATLMNGVKEGDVFVLPSGWDYQVTEYTDGSKLAFLCHATEQPEPEESQEELWNEAEGIIAEAIGTYKTFLTVALSSYARKELEKHFTITRKP